MLNRRSIIARLAAAILPAGFLAAKASGHSSPISSDDIDQLRVQLAGCGVAATGWNHDPATPDMWGWSPSYQDVLDLRRKFEAAMHVIAERTPEGWRIALYPCGCWANDTDGLPGYCSEHGDSEHTDRVHVIQGTQC